MSDYRWLNEASLSFLEKDYLPPGQSLDSRVDVICHAAESYLGKPGWGARFKERFQKGWYSLSSPIWANFGTQRGLPISCFGSYVEDSMESILATHAEVGMMTKYGGGTAAYFGNLRGRGSPIRGNGESSGSVHFARLFDVEITTISQGSTRRGNFAGYWPIDHEDIWEVLSIKSEGSPIQDLSFAVCVPDAWLEDMVAGDMEKRRVWARVIECRCNTGYPYLFFTDNANRNKPACYKDMPILHSQLCSEIFLPTSPAESFVCDLASLNVLYFEEWEKDPEAVPLLVELLDAVMTEFIFKAASLPYMERAVRFAVRHRALGVGWLGLHSLLQSKLVPWESPEAFKLNARVARHVQAKTLEASARLAREYGEPEVCKGHGRRNTTLCAIAPTKSSSFILGQASEGIEPFKTNYYIKDLAKGKFTFRNPYLMKLLEEKGENTAATWESVIKKGGSVQHLPFLDAHEKAVFKTFAEISPLSVVQQAAQRQQFIDQGQSLNLMIHPTAPARDINRLLLEGWRMGIKSFYYQHSVNAAQAFSRDILSCSSCEA